MNRLKELRTAKGFTLQEVANRANTTHTQILRLENGDRRLTTDWLQRLAPVLEVEPAEIMTAPKPALPAASEELAPNVDISSLRHEGLVGARDLPIYASAQGGPDGMIVTFDPIEWVKRPQPLLNVKGGFGVYVVNDSMSPKFEQGDQILVHPTKPAKRGDFVFIVQRYPDGTQTGMVKRFVRLREGALEVEQFNPALTFSLDLVRVAGIHVVVGTYFGR